MSDCCNEYLSSWQRFKRRLWWWYIRLFRSHKLVFDKIDSFEFDVEKKQYTFRIEEYYPRKKNFGIVGIKLLSQKRHCLYAVRFPLIILQVNDWISITMHVKIVGGHKVRNELKWVGDIRFQVREW